MFAKMVKGEAVVASQPLVIGRRKVYTNDPALWLSQGYKTLVNTPKPVGDGVVVAKYHETDTEIIREWVIL